MSYRPSPLVIVVSVVKMNFRWSFNLYIESLKDHLYQISATLDDFL